MKTIENLNIYLDDEQLEFQIDGVYYTVEFDVYSYECEFDSMTFYYVNEESDSVLIKRSELNKFGFDERFRYWLFYQIEDRLKFEYETKFYEENPLLTLNNDYEY